MPPVWQHVREYEGHPHRPAVMAHLIGRPLANVISTHRRFRRSYDPVHGAAFCAYGATAEDPDLGDPDRCHALVPERTTLSSWPSPIDNLTVEW